MEEPDKTVFFDTNCFIHIRDAKDLPWAQLFPGVKWVEIVVAPIVIDELDELKIGRESRRRNRSRLALNLIERASSEANLKLTLKDGSPKVSLRLHDGAHIDWSEFPKLVPTRPDDQLVATALVESRKVPCVLLLSHDTGPLIRARIAGLDAYRPPDDWHLCEPPGESEKEIALLKRELELQRSTKPKVSAAFLQNGVPVHNIRSRIPLLPPLSKAVQDTLYNEYLKLHPKVFLGPRDAFRYTINDFMVHDRYTDHDIDSYAREYKNFCVNVRNFFASFHESVRQFGRAAPIHVELKNEGALTARNLIVKLERDETSILVASRDQVEQLVGRISPPLPPEKPSRGQLIVPPYLHNLDQDAHRDPTAFYWQERPTADNPSTSSICPEFRAKCERVFSYWLLPRKRPYGGKIRLEITATNLDAPVLVDATIELKEECANWSDPDVLETLQPWIAEKFVQPD